MGAGGAGGGATAVGGNIANAGGGNTGGGGGGVRAVGYSTAFGGNGGSGIVVIRYADTYPDITTISGGLTYARTTPTGYKVYTFTAGTGTVTI
jgi:hypothetical protein